MKREDIERKLDAAVSGMIPKDMFDRISENIVSANPKAIERVMKKEKKKNFNIFSRSFMGVAAAACILLVAGIIGVPYYGNNFVPDSHVDIDVNPGVEIVTNKKNKVLNVQSTNKDGDSVIDGMNLKNTELKVAVNALIGSMVQKGYIANNNTGILVTVRNDNPEKANKVKEEVLYDINFALYTNDVQANVMNQTFKNNADADKFARENNISIGKAVFVLNLAAKDSSLDAKELAKMKVTDIANLVAKKGIDIRDIVDYDSDDSIWENIADAIEDIDEDAREKGIATSVAVENTTVSATSAAQPATTQPAATVAPAATTVQTNNTSADIGIEKAKEIAMSHAGVSAGSVSFVKAKLDHEDGVKVYDIEFYSGNVEYDYEINAATGAIVSFDQDIENYAVPTQPQTAAPTQAQTASVISVDKAKQIALSHAGVSGASFTKVKLDTDDGVRVYEIEFKVGNVEYDYDIDASSGAIISSSSEIDD